jgi:hypothetical protein
MTILIEILSNRPLDVYLQESLFEPLGKLESIAVLPAQRTACSPSGTMCYEEGLVWYLRLGC